MEDYWKDNGWVDLFRLDPNLAKLRKSLNYFFLNQKEDVLIWGKEPNGVYSVASAYANSFDNHDEPCWAKAWMKGMTPKVNIFFWILLQNKVLTLDNLKKGGIVVINRCVLCKNDGESIDHITLHCPFFVKILDSIFLLLKVEWVFPSNLQLFFISWKAPSKNSLIGKL